MKTRILIFLASIFIFSACLKENLNLEGAQYYDVMRVLDSRNCSSKCEEPADCEGGAVKIIGMLAEDNYVPSENKFFILDRYENRTEIEARVDSINANAIFNLLAGQDEKNVRIDGVLQGYDSNPGGSSCTRIIYVAIDEPSQIEIIE